MSFPANLAKTANKEAFSISSLIASEWHKADRRQAYNKLILESALTIGPKLLFGLAAEVITRTHWVLIPAFALSLVFPGVVVPFLLSTKGILAVVAAASALKILALVGTALLSAAKHFLAIGVIFGNAYGYVSAKTTAVAMDSATQSGRAFFRHPFAQGMMIADKMFIGIETAGRMAWTSTVGKHGLGLT